MHELTRRKLLGCVGAGSAIVSAGCVDGILDSEADEARLHTLRARNAWGDANVEVDVTVEDVDGGSIFSDTWELERGDEWGEPEAVTERGEYVARAEVGDLEEEVDIVEAADGEDICVGLEFVTGTDEDGVPNSLTSNVYGFWDDC